MLINENHKMDLCIINTFLSEQKYDKCKKYFDKNNFELNLKGYASLHFRYGIAINDDNIISYYLVNINKLKQIDIILYCIHIYNTDFDSCKNIFQKNIINNHSLQSKSLDKLIENNCDKLLFLLNGYYIKSKYKLECNFPLKRYNFYDTDNIIEFYKNKITMYDELLLKLNNIDCIVDGGNIVHHKKGIIDYNMVNIMDINIKKKFKNPLYIFNVRHKKKLNKFLKNSNVNIFITPSKEYDDIYIILASILTNNYIITNDTFRDHIFMIKDIDKSFTIEKLQDNIVNYNKKKLGEIKKYSSCVQINNNNISQDFIYIPYS